MQIPHTRNYGLQSLALIAFKVTFTVSDNSKVTQIFLFLRMAFISNHIFFQLSLNPDCMVTNTYRKYQSCPKVLSLFLHNESAYYP